MDEKPRQILSDLIREYGTLFYKDRTRLSGLLRDKCDGCKAEINLLLLALEEGVPTAFEVHGKNTDLGILLGRLIKRLRDERHLTEEAARWTVESWALALEIASITEIMEWRAKTTIHIVAQRRETGCLPDPCVAVAQGVFPPAATLHRKPEGKHKVPRHGVKPFVELSAGQAPWGEVRLDGERRAAQAGVAKVVAKLFAPEIGLDPISGLAKNGNSPQSPTIIGLDNQQSMPKTADEQIKIDEVFEQLQNSTLSSVPMANPISDVAPTVFISYAHSSPEQKKTVSDFVGILRKKGVKVLVDTNIESPQGPEEGWIRWMKLRLREADWVLIFFDDVYLRRYEGYEDTGCGHGANWEAIFISHELYRCLGKNSRFIPLLAGNIPKEIIPNELFGATYYRIPNQSELLADKLIAHRKSNKTNTIDTNKSVIEPSNNENKLAIKPIITKERRRKVGLISIIMAIFTIISIIIITQFQDNAQTRPKDTPINELRTTTNTL